MVIQLLLVALSAYRVGEMLGPHGGDGPLAVLERFRIAAGVRRDAYGIASGRHVIGEVFACQKCLTFWAAIVAGILSIAFGELFLYVMLPVAAAGAAELLRVHNG